MEKQNTMIKLQQIADSTKIKEIAKKVDELTKTVEGINEGQLFWQNLIKTLEVIIWPIAIILILYLFKKQIGSIFDRFESANVSASGFAVKLKQGAIKIGEGSSSTLALGDDGEMIAKSGANMIPEDGDEMIPESSDNIKPLRSQAETPYQGMMELQDAINYKLQRIATEKGITTTGFSNFSLTSDLAKRGLLDKHTASKLKTLIELNTLGLNSPEITHEQVTQMKRLFNNISF